MHGAMKSRRVSRGHARLSEPHPVGASHDDTIRWLMTGGTRPVCVHRGGQKKIGREENGPATSLHGNNRLCQIGYLVCSVAEMMIHCTGTSTRIEKNEVLDARRPRDSDRRRPVGNTAGENWNLSSRRRQNPFIHPPPPPTRLANIRLLAFMAVVLFFTFTAPAASQVRPIWSEGESIGDLTFLVGQTDIRDTTFPEVATRRSQVRYEMQVTYGRNPRILGADARFNGKLRLAWDGQHGRRRFVGTPDARAIGTYPMTYAAVYLSPPANPDERIVSAPLFFSLTIARPPLSLTTRVPPQTYTVGTAIETLRLPEADSDSGVGEKSYTLQGAGGADLSTAVPGLSFNRATRQLSGMPTALRPPTLLTYTVTDSASPMPDSVSVTVTVTVVAAPLQFAVDQTDLRVARNMALTPLTLPDVHATNRGYGALSFRLTSRGGALFADLSFKESNRELSGTPTVALGVYPLTYRVTDATGTLAEHTFRVIVERLPVCDRTPQVRGRIVSAVREVVDCARVTAEHLALITDLPSLRSQGIQALQADDFAGLTALNHLHLGSNRLSTLPENVFADLTSLHSLYLDSNRLHTLPAGVFDGLTEVLLLDLDDNRLSTLPAGVFADLRSVVTLYLNSNRLNTLPEDVFAGLTALGNLHLSSNRLHTLPAGAFADLNRLISLSMDSNFLPGALPPGLFDPLLDTLTSTLLANNPALTEMGIPPLFPAKVGVAGAAVALEEQAYRVTFALSNAVPFAVKLPYTVTLGGGATASDFADDGDCAAPEDGSAVIAAGQTSAEIDFCITADAADESGETLTLALGAVEVEGTGGEKANEKFPTADFVMLTDDTTQHVVVTNLLDPRLIFIRQQPDLHFIAGISYSVTLPEAIGGVPPLSYTLPTLRLSGAGFNSETRVLSGVTLTATTAPVPLTYRVADDAGAVAAMTFSVTIDTMDTTPREFRYTAPDSLTVGVAIAAIDPETGDTDIMEYAVAGGELPDGLIFAPATGRISGTPTMATTAPAAVTFTGSGAADNTSTAALTFPAVDKGMQDLSRVAYTPATVALGAAAPILTAPTVRDNAVLTYTSGDIGVCTVDGTSGGLMLVAVGACDITVTAAATANYDTADVTVTVTVIPDPLVFFEPLTFATTEVPTQTYTIGVPIETLTLPEAGGGAAPLRYALTGSLNGLVFDGAAAPRTLSGTPTMTTDTATALTFTVTDSAPDPVSISLTVSVDIYAAPVLATQDDLTYAANSVVNERLPVAVARHGAPPRTYTLRTDSGAVVRGIPPAQVPGLSGLAFDATSSPPTLRGRPSVETPPAGVMLTHVLTDKNGAHAETAFHVFVTSGPDFQGQSVGDMTYIAGMAIPPLTLPAATGIGALDYALSGHAGSGLDFSAVGSANVVSGTPTLSDPRRVDAYTLTWSATDSWNLVATVRFTITIVPALAFDTAVDDLTYATDFPVTRTLPAAVGVSPLIYTLTPAVGGAVPGLIFHGTPAAGRPAARRLAGVPTTPASAVTFAYTVTDKDGATATRGFTITIVDAVRFVEGDDIRDHAQYPRLQYGSDQRIDRPLILPEATGGAGTLIYTMAKQGDFAGLTFRDFAGRPVTSEANPAAPSAITGLMAAGGGKIIWKATDDATQAFAALTFRITTRPFTDLNHVVLPEIARAIADQNTSAITRRLRQATAARAGSQLPTPIFTVAGRSTAAGILATSIESLATGAIRLTDLLHKTDFTLPLTADAVVSDVPPAAGLSTLTLWGNGDYRRLGGESGPLDWDGDLVSAHLGADLLLRPDTLAGLAVSWHQSIIDYDDADSPGAHDVDMTTIHPYLGWSAFGGRLDLWVTAGYGLGEMEITPAARDTGAGDLTLRTVGLGASGKFFETSSSTIRFKAELLQTELDVDGGAGIAALDVEARRARLTLEAAHTHALDNGARLSPTVEVGARHDGGDGRTGSGAEVGANLRYTDPVLGLTVESHGRVLLAHNGDYDDWGIGGSLSVDPGIAGRGLVLSLQPAWGRTASRVARIWAQEQGVAATGLVSRPPYTGHLALRLGYGLDWAETRLTPYGQVTLDADSRAYRLGGRMQVGHRVALNVGGTRVEPLIRPVEYGIRLHIELGW